MRALSQAAVGRTVNRSSKTVLCLVLPVPEAGSKAVRTLILGFTYMSTASDIPVGRYRSKLAGKHLCMVLTHTPPYFDALRVHTERKLECTLGSPDGRGISKPDS